MEVKTPGKERHFFYINYNQSGEWEYSQIQAEITSQLHSLRADPHFHSSRNEENSLLIEYNASGDFPGKAILLYRLFRERFTQAQWDFTSAPVTIAAGISPGGAMWPREIINQLMPGTFGIASELINGNPAFSHFFPLPPDSPPPFLSPGYLKVDWDIYYPGNLPSVRGIMTNSKGEFLEDLPALLPGLEDLKEKIQAVEPGEGKISLFLEEEECGIPGGLIVMREPPENLTTGDLIKFGRELGDFSSSLPEKSFIRLHLISAGLEGWKFADIFQALGEGFVRNSRGRKTLIIDTLKKNAYRQFDPFKLEGNLFSRQEELMIRPDYTADSMEGDDRLSRLGEARAFAELIADRDVTPPLSVGVFGDWGSGKSFFMKLIKQEVNKLIGKVQKKKLSRRFFCSHIAQVDFNAWHYVDTNLWASLAEHIFDSLSRYLGNESEEQTERQKLYENLATVKQLKEKIKEKKNVNTRQLARIEEKIRFKETVCTIGYILGKLRENPFLGKKLRKTILEIDDGHLEELENQVPGLKDSLGKLKEALTPEPAGESKTENTAGKFRIFKRYWTGILLAVLITGGIFFVIKITVLNKLLNELWKALLAALAPGAGVLFAYINKQPAAVKEGIKTLLQLTLKKPGEMEKAIDPVAIKKELEILKACKLDIENEQFRAETEESRIYEAIRTSHSRNLLTRFIGDRVSEKKYEQELGIISLVRKDFERLSEYLHDNICMEFSGWELARAREYIRKADHESFPCLKEAEDLLCRLYRDEEGKKWTGKAPEKKYNLQYPLCEKDALLLKPVMKFLGEKEREENTAGPLSFSQKIDRIVLYIDDLDRCPPDKVFDLLQAIHLLLAFPLFVVIVGVDIRWIFKSLLKENHFALGDGIDNEDFNLLMKGEATPFDYLEKIFQIPFHLRPMDDNFKKEYLKNLILSPALLKAWEKETLTREKLPGKEKKESPILFTPLDRGSYKNYRQQIEKIFRGTLEIPGNLKNERGYQAMQIEEAELTVIYSLTPLLCCSPRTLKRFTNIYKIMKANSGGFKLTREHYPPLLLLLGINIGLPHLAPLILKDLPLAARQTRIIPYLTTFPKPPDNKQYENIKPELDRLQDWAGNLEEKLIPLLGKENRELREEVIALWAGLTTGEAAELVPLVSRFTFRHQ